jgi:hypothetical protein
MREQKRTLERGRLAGPPPGEIERFGKDGNRRLGGAAAVQSYTEDGPGCFCLDRA